MSDGFSPAQKLRKRDLFPTQNEMNDAAGTDTCSTLLDVCLTDCLTHVLICRDDSHNNRNTTAASAGLLHTALIIDRMPSVLTGTYRSASRPFCLTAIAEPAAPALYNPGASRFLPAGSYRMPPGQNSAYNTFPGKIIHTGNLSYS